VKKILIADDDAGIRAAMAVRLEAEGYLVVTSGDGQQAIVLAQREGPDLAILDISMPKADGFTVAKAIRSHSVASNTPVIFMTGKSDPGYFDEAMHQDGIAFLGKPFDSNVLLPLVACGLDTGIP